MMFSERYPRIGDVYVMNFHGIGSEQRGWRPGLVFQNNIGNAHSPNVIALPMTSSLKNLDLPTHVLVPAHETGLRTDSLVLCENPQRMSKENIGKYLTTIPAKYMRKIAAASVLSTSAIAFLDPDALLSIWQQAVEFNILDI